MSETILKVNGLKQHFSSKKYTNKAVDGISFEIKKGEVHGLVGESGCGKTTTGRSIIRLYDITGGEVIFKDTRIAAGHIENYQFIKEAKAKAKEEIAAATTDEAKAKIREELASFIKEQNAIIAHKKNDHRKVKRDLLTKIQMIFQDPIDSLNPRMTVREIISEGLEIMGEKDRDVINKKVIESLNSVGLLEEHGSRYPHEFSGGQRQRIGIARALIMQPELVIADEPISALDVSIQAQVINLLNDLKEKHGLTILFIAHDLSVVKYFCDKISVMHFGKIVESASSDKLFANPLHPYTKSLLSAIPYPDPVFEKSRKRIKYNASASHDYSVDKPIQREVSPGHFVLCNEAEFKEYQRIYK